MDTSPNVRSTVEDLEWINCRVTKTPRGCIWMQEVGYYHIERPPGPAGDLQ